MEVGLEGNATGKVPLEAGLMSDTAGKTPCETDGQLETGNSSRPMTGANQLNIRNKRKADRQKDFSNWRSGNEMDQCWRQTTKWASGT